MHLLLYWLVLITIIYPIESAKNCYLQAADASMRACLKFLDVITENEIPQCSDEDALKVCKSELPSSSLPCPESCAEVFTQGSRKNGIYKICPKSWFHVQSKTVYCDLETKGGGWTVLQRRGDYKEPSDSFSRNWTEYKNGFGNLSTQFWLGNDYIFVLTNQEHVILRIELEDFDNNKRWAEYNDFRIENEVNSYKFSILGNYSGNAGDSLSFHKGMEFYTQDRDNWMKCARDRNGGWWYFSCLRANLNGMYVEGGKPQNSNSGRLISWGSFNGYNYSLKKTEMKIRPAYF